MGIFVSGWFGDAKEAQLTTLSGSKCNFNPPYFGLGEHGSDELNSLCNSSIMELM